MYMFYHTCEFLTKQSMSTPFLQKHLHLNVEKKHMLKWPIQLGQTSQCLAVLSKVLVNSIC